VNLGGCGPTERRAAWLFALLVFVCVFHDLGARSLHELDTARWGQLAREMIRSGEWLVPTRYGEVYANKPVLYLWAVAGPSYLFGEVTPLLVRLPSALGLLALVFTCAAWMRMRSGSREAGRIAGLLVLGTFLVAWQGREGRLDMMGTALSFGAAYGIDRAALGLGRRRTPWLAGLLLGAALLTKGPPLLLVPVAALFAPAAGRSMRQRLSAARPLLVLGVAFGCALLWFVPAAISGGEAYGKELLFKQAAERVSGGGNYIRPFWHHLLYLPATAAPWGLAYLAVFAAVFVPRGRRSLGPLAGIALAGAAVLLVFSLVPTKHYRYLSPLVPLLAMGLAWWIWRWLQAPARAPWARHLRALAIVLGLAATTAVVVGVLRPSALVAGLVPAAGFAALAGAAWRGASATRGAAGVSLRRTFVTCVLAGVALGLLAQASLRPHLYTTARERFNRALLDRAKPGIPVFLVPPTTPEDVFLGAPQARFPLMAGDPLPADVSDPVLVVCRRENVTAVRKGAGRAGRILDTGDEKSDWVLLGFGYP